MQERYGALKRALVTSGLPVDPMARKKPVADADAQGGPFVPVPLSAESVVASAVFPALPDDVRADIHSLEALGNVLVSLPLGDPSETEEHSSTFGVRRDPFTGKPALHTGIDFHPGPDGRAHATAPGKVLFAGRGGAYGLSLIHI